jgi:hypothetical protein
VGDEKIGSVQTEHLQLTPLAEKVKKSFPALTFGSIPKDFRFASNCSRPGVTTAWRTTQTFA